MQSDMDRYLDRLASDGEELYRAVTPLYGPPAQITYEELDILRRAVIETHLSITIIQANREREKSWLRRNFYRK